MFQSYDRVGTTDILPHLAMERAEIFIKKMDETIHWQIFVDSLSTNSWLLIITGKSLSKALLFAEHGENMLCTKIVLNVSNNFCTQHVLPRFEHGIFMY